MKWSALPVLAMRDLKRHSLRTTLTALGIIIGVAAVITMVGLGQGARHDVEEQVNRLGQNVVLVFPGSQQLGGVNIGQGTRNLLSVEDAHAIRNEIPEVIAASPEVRSQTQIVFGNRNWNTRVYGQSHDYLQIRQWPLESGEMFTEEDVAMASTVGVVGQTIVDEVFEGSDPVGQTVRIRGVPIRIIGVLVPERDEPHGVRPGRHRHSAVYHGLPADLGSDARHGDQHPGL